jgi:hypothetical protein
MHKCSGGCHCGRVKIAVEVPDEIVVHRCNCSICRKSGYLHLIVAEDQFSLLEGEADLVDYRFHTAVARHLFCGFCGIKSFYIPRSHPGSFSVNLNFIILPVGVDVTIKESNGRNWSESRGQLSNG